MTTHYDTRAVSTPGATPPVWLKAASEVQEHVNKIAGRSDIAVHIGPDAAVEAKTAHWIPSSAEMAFHTPALLPGVKPDTVEIHDRLWRLRHPAFVGAMLHESGHAAYSVTVPADYAKWKDADGVGFTPREADVINVLEESRVEALILRRRMTDRKFMTRMALEIVLPEFKIADNAYGASMGAALTVARGDAGSLYAAVARRFRRMILDSGQLDKDTLDKLRELWTEYQGIDVSTRAIRDGYATWPWEKVRRIARDWIKLVVPEGEDESGEGGADLASSGVGAPGDDESGEGEGGGLGAVIKAEAREESLDIEAEITEEARSEADARDIKDRETAAEAAREGKRAEKEVMSSAANHGRGDAMSKRRITAIRQPEPDERAAATRFAKELGKITTHDKVVMTTRSKVPPGRVHGRTAVLGAAQVAQRATVTAEPFAMKRRHAAETDKVRIAILSDISGSMSEAEVPLGVTSYVLGRGAAVADAQVTSILCGDKSLAVIKPGQKVDQVIIPNAADGHEVVKPALMAADSALDLTTGTGARVVIIMSDGQLVDHTQAEYMRSWLRVAKRTGVAVLWISWGRLRPGWYGEQLNAAGMNPARVAEAAGKAVVKAVAKAQASQSA